MTEETKTHPTVGEAVLYLLFRYRNLDAESVNPAWFDYEWERMIYDRIVQWRLEGNEPDLVAFSRDKLAFFDLYSRCEAAAVVPSQFASHCQVLRLDFTSLKVWKLLDEVKVMDDDAAIEKICAFADEVRSAKVVSLKATYPKDFASEYLEALESAKNKKEMELPTGFPTLDKWTYGLHRGEVVIVGARPGIGKSTLMLNIASKLLKEKKKILFFSTEMSVTEQWSRLIPILTNIQAFRFRTADFKGDDWQKITGKVEWLHTENAFVVCDLPSPTIEQVSELVHKCKPDVVILDYLQRFTMPSADRMDLSIGDFLKTIKTLSRTENCAMLVASQLNRGVENRQLKIPTLADLRESGNIEQEADVVLLMAVEADVAPNKELGLGIAKNRHGQTGSVKLFFTGETLTMHEMERQELARRDING